MNDHILDSVFARKDKSKAADEQLLKKTSPAANPERKDIDKLNVYRKPVIVNSKPGNYVDKNFVSYNLYNSFNYSFFIPEGHERVKCALGVTSANRGEGKTTTACSLATAISIGTNRKTIIIDFNLNKPRLNEIFGIAPKPGLTDALQNEEIYISRTQIENLYVIPAGGRNGISVYKLANFPKIIKSLLHEFEFIIVDMPSLDAKNFPTIIANQLNGLIVVAEVRKTKRRDIERLFRQVHERNVIGFVLNKVNEDDF